MYEASAEPTLCKARATGARSHCRAKAKSTKLNLFELCLARRRNTKSNKNCGRKGIRMMNRMLPLQDRSHLTITEKSIFEEGYIFFFNCLNACWLGRMYPLREGTLPENTANRLCTRKFLDSYILSLTLHHHAHCFQPNGEGQRTGRRGLGNVSWGPYKWSRKRRTRCLERFRTGRSAMRLRSYDAMFALVQRYFPKRTPSTPPLLHRAYWQIKKGGEEIDVSCEIFLRKEWFSQI